MQIPKFYLTINEYHSFLILVFFFSFLVPGLFLKTWWKLQSGRLGVNMWPGRSILRPHGRTGAASSQSWMKMKSQVDSVFSEPEKLLPDYTKVCRISRSLHVMFPDQLNPFQVYDTVNWVSSTPLAVMKKMQKVHVQLGNKILLCFLPQFQKKWTRAPSPSPPPSDHLTGRPWATLWNGLVAETTSGLV